MRDFTCFGENGVQIADSSSSPAATTPQNLVTSIYRCRLQNRAYLITVTWTKHLMGQGLSVVVEDSANQCLCKVDIKPWLFSKRKGSKNIESSKIEISWDLSNAKFGSSPEPLEEFFLAIVFNHEDMILLLGDLREEAYRKTSTPKKNLTSGESAICVAKREHIFGKKTYYCGNAQFSNIGKEHEVGIECDAVDSRLVIRIDGKMAVQVKRLKWKFRGNETILVDGDPVEVFWDVHNWLFGNGMGSGVFMFQTSVSAQSGYHPGALAWSSLQSNLKDAPGFSMVLYAWKCE